MSICFLNSNVRETTVLDSYVSLKELNEIIYHSWLEAKLLIYKYISVRYSFIKYHSCVTYTPNVWRTVSASDVWANY